MRITQRTLDNYRREVDAQADIAGGYMMDVMDAFFRTYPNADTAASRNMTIEVMKTALANFCEAAGTLSADFFDEITEALGIEAESRLYETMDYSYVDQKVRFFAKFLNEGDTSRFKKEVVDVTRYFVKRSAYENMVENCVGNQLRYARVPTGLETCAFCFMLASRGFVYNSERKAGDGHKYHQNCDCIVVPGSVDSEGNPRVKIDGYDPQVMYDNWRKCAETIGVNPMSTSEDVRKAIMREVETRDWHWLYTGDAAVTDYRKKPYEELEEWEQKAADYLSQKHGVSLATIKENDNAPANLDFSMLNHEWELKSPKSGNHAVDDRLTDAFAKFKKLKLDEARIIICNSESSRSDEDVLDECLRRIAYRKKVGQFEVIEFIFLSHDGERMLRYKF